MGRKNLPITVAVSRVTTPGDCRFKLHLAFNVAFFVHVPQLVFERLAGSFGFTILPGPCGSMGIVKTPAAPAGFRKSLTMDSGP